MKIMGLIPLFEGEITAFRKIQRKIMKTSRLTISVKFLDGSLWALKSVPSKELCCSDIKINWRK
jgi:hypothetical protein